MNATQLSSSSPFVSVKKAEWEGFSLAHYRLRTGYLPEHVVGRHTVHIPLGDGCHGEISTPQGLSTWGTQSPGSVCVIPCGHPFAATTRGESEHITIYVEPALVSRAASPSRSSVEVLEKVSASDPVVTTVGMALLAELESQGESSKLYAESLANVLAVHLLRHYAAFGSPAPAISKGGLSGKRLRRVVDFIRDNYATDISITDLAELAGMSPFHFAREFKRATGITPHQYLINSRIERAKTLLTESRMPLVEVGFQSGFSHQSHFTRLFRKVAGTTPLSYRTRMQG
jgi:AraC family transcriptional regulator